VHGSSLSNLCAAICAYITGIVHQVIAFLKRGVVMAWRCNGPLLVKPLAGIED
jgi:hypothetical protein